MPASGTYRIEAFGAQGGNISGRGAKLQGDFNLNLDEVLKIAVGQAGSGQSGNGGGGGSFTVRSPTNNVSAILLYCRRRRRI